MRIKYSCLRVLSLTVCLKVQVLCARTHPSVLPECTV